VYTASIPTATCPDAEASAPYKLHVTVGTGYLRIDTSTMERFGGARNMLVSSGEAGDQYDGR
jgi:hypothetical protein